MKEKFCYRSELADTVRICGIIAISFIIMPIFAVTDGNLFIFFLIFAVYIAVCCLLERVPSRFETDENSVIFVTCGIKEVIKYEDILTINTSRQYRELPTRYSTIKRYEEIIEFSCKDGEKRTYSCIMDIDFEKLAENPENLTEQFENGKFVRLKNYILGTSPL